MSKKENERDIFGLLSRLRESLRWPKKETEPEITEEDSAFSQELSDRLGKHLEAESAQDAEASMQEGEEESEFAVEELEIVADGTLDPDAVAEDEVPTEDEVAAAEDALFSNLDVLTARMTPEQRAAFEAEMALDDTAAVDDPIEEASSPDQTDAGDESAKESIDEDAEETSETENETAEASAADDDAVEEVIEEEEGDIYTTPEEDEDYDLPETEAFRALGARMTAEQRAQFEQALAEAQEAERAEKAAKKEARRAARLAAEAQAEAEASAPTQADTADEPIPNPVAEHTEDAVPTETLTFDEEDAVAEEVARNEEVSVEPEEDSSGSAIFFAVDEDSEEADMPAIKVGAERSSFSLFEEPEPEEPILTPDEETVEQESGEETEIDEKAVLAALFERMTPEQFARFLEEMFYDEDADDISLPDEEVPVLEEELPTEALPEEDETDEEWENAEEIVIVPHDDGGESEPSVFILQDRKPPVVPQDETDEANEADEAEPMPAWEEAMAFSDNAAEREQSEEEPALPFSPEGLAEEEAIAAEADLTEDADVAVEEPEVIEENEIPASDGEASEEAEEAAESIMIEELVTEEDDPVIMEESLSEEDPVIIEQIATDEEEPVIIEETVAQDAETVGEESYAEDEEEQTIPEESVSEEENDASADVADVSDEDEINETADEATEKEDEEDLVAAILNDPEKLEELMVRLTPEQAAEMKRVLREEFGLDDEEITPVESAEEVTEEPAEEPASESEQRWPWDDPQDDLFDENISEDILPAQEDTLAEDLPPEADDEENIDPSEETDAPFVFAEGDIDSDLPHADHDTADRGRISDDMSDDEILLMLELGYENELLEILGKQRVEQVKKRTSRDHAKDVEFTDAYAYEGEEYRYREQTDRIRYNYGAERRRLWVRLAGTSVFALLLFLYECCGLFRGAFGGILDAAHYPVIAIMVGWQLLVFAAAFSWKQLARGIKSAFLLEPDSHAMTAIVVIVVMFSNILMAMVFKGSHLSLYNFPAALCLLCSVLCDFADICREELTFEVISSDRKKYVAESITLSSAYTDMPTSSMKTDKENPLSSKNAIYVRRAGFVKNYFRRTNRKTRHAQILNFVFLPLLAFAVVLGVVTAVIGHGTVASLSSFVAAMLLCMPLSYMVVHALPLFYETRRLHKQGCAIVGEGSVEEYNQYSAVVFEDKALFPPMLIKTKGLKLYENNLIYSVIWKISLLFREIGGPINEVLDLDKEEMKRFLASGQAGVLADGKVTLESVTEDGIVGQLNDGSSVVAGSAAFLRTQGIYVRVSEKDQQLIDSGSMSILYLAFDGRLGARFYVDYRPDPEFEALAGMLHEDGFRVAVRTLDPGIHEGMILHKCPKDMPKVHTVRAKRRELTEKTSNEAKVDGGLVCSGDPRKILLPLRAIRNLRRLNHFALRMYAVALIINAVVAIILTALGVLGYMSSLFVSLYMLVWLATSLVMTALFLNK